MRGVFVLCSMYVISEFFFFFFSSRKVELEFYVLSIKVSKKKRNRLKLGREVLANRKES